MVVVLFCGGINTDAKIPKTQRWLLNGICLFSLKPSFPEHSTVLEGTEVLKVAGMFVLPIVVGAESRCFSIVLVIWVSQCSNRKRTRVVGWPLHSVGSLEVAGIHDPCESLSGSALMREWALRQRHIHGLWYLVERRTNNWGCYVSEGCHVWTEWLQMWNEYSTCCTLEEHNAG